MSYLSPLSYRLYLLYPLLCPLLYLSSAKDHEFVVRELLVEDSARAKD